MDGAFELLHQLLALLLLVDVPIEVELSQDVSRRAARHTDAALAPFEAIGVYRFEAVAPALVALAVAALVAVPAALPALAVVALAAVVVVLVITVSTH